MGRIKLIIALLSVMIFAGIIALYSIIFFGGYLKEKNNDLADSSWVSSTEIVIGK